MSNLGQWNKAYADAPVENRGELPDGVYRVKVDTVELTTTKGSGDDMLAWKLKVVGEGAYEGRVIFHNRVIATEEQVKFLKQELVTAGLVLDDLEQLPNRLNDLLDVVLDVQKKSKTKDGKTYTNLYFNKRVDVDGDLPF